jgi:hypothetical protein
MDKVCPSRSFKTWCERSILNLSLPSLRIGSPPLLIFLGDIIPPCLRSEVLLKNASQHSEVRWRIYVLHLVPRVHVPIHNVHLTRSGRVLLSPWRKTRNDFIAIIEMVQARDETAASILSAQCSPSGVQTLACWPRLPRLTIPACEIMVR